MPILFGDQLQSVWSNLLNDPLIVNILEDRNYAFFNQGPTYTATIPFHKNYNPLPFWVLPLLWDTNRIHNLQVSQEITYREMLHECVVIYALVDKLILRKKKAYSSPTCVDVCLNANSPIIIALAKAGLSYSPAFHDLLISEFKKFKEKDNKRTEPPKDCKIITCKEYDKRIANNYSKCCNVLENCAEQRAANDILQAPQVTIPSLSNLRFSLALRPRTMEAIAYCYNCVTIFPQLK